MFRKVILLFGVLVLLILVYFFMGTIDTRKVDDNFLLLDLENTKSSESSLYSSLGDKFFSEMDQYYYPFIINYNDYKSLFMCTRVLFRNEILGRTYLQKNAPLMESLTPLLSYDTFGEAVSSKTSYMTLKSTIVLLLDIHYNSYTKTNSLKKLKLLFKNLELVSQRFFINWSQSFYCVLSILNESFNKFDKKSIDFIKSQLDNFNIDLLLKKEIQWYYTLNKKNFFQNNFFTNELSKDLYPKDSFVRKFAFHPNRFQKDFFDECKKILEQEDFLFKNEDISSLTKSSYYEFFPRWFNKKLEKIYMPRTQEIKVSFRYLKRDLNGKINFFLYQIEACLAIQKKVSK